MRIRRLAALVALVFTVLATSQGAKADAICASLEHPVRIEATCVPLP